MPDLDRWRSLIAEHGLDGWLIADFRWNNPLFSRLLDLHAGVLTRRAFLWLPAIGRGEPLILLSRVDGHTVAQVGWPSYQYAGFEEMATQLKSLLPRGGRIAIEYTEGGKLPTTSRVDAGMVELIRSYGVTVETSSLLIAALEVWSERQRELHLRAARIVDDARRLALERCGEWLRAGERVTEGRVAEVINTVFRDASCVVHAPDVGVNANGADPHYGIHGEGAEIGRDDVLLIDLSTRLAEPQDAPYADSTWMSYTGTTPPADVQRAFDVTRAARDAAIEAIDSGSRDGQSIQGREIDRIARGVIADAGLADRIMHRTGHSLGTDHVHGMGTNLDDIEFPDDRPLLVNSGFTVEPGIYFPGQFGIRMEVSAILESDGVRVTTERQDQLTLI